MQQGSGWNEYPFIPRHFYPIPGSQPPMDGICLPRAKKIYWNEQDNISEQFGSHDTKKRASQMDSETSPRTRSLNPPGPLPISDSANSKGMEDGRHLRRR
ncbi:hypothetical protein VC83_02473 [Pseudogymnoascus destructans]|uniref:Uncharacterized protein n=1 Tax=Pseudogymnoascus destructans TaxID=655981 RepID=A0A177AHD7_9PEZI|nr:uncharacterized protein VC83_02473 [Pseudogymnoascus destructans]OAF61210.1 hypothetical protein VC83_02473 [Pseudogymnoascus destructans]